MKTLEELGRMPFTVVIRRDAEGDFVARVEELRGCVAHGATAQEAFERLEEAKHLWLTDALEAGDSIPEALSDDDLPSGKWVQRVPRTLHRKLTDLARREGVSLNQLVTSMLAEGVGRKQELVLLEPLRSQGRKAAVLFAWQALAEQWKTLRGEWLIHEHGASILGSALENPIFFSCALDWSTKNIPNEIKGSLGAGERGLKEERHKHRA